MISFTQKDVCEIVGLKPRQVQWLAEAGIILPGVAESVAPGGVRRYSSANLIDFAIAFELLEFRITKEIIRSIIQGIDKIKDIHVGLLHEVRTVLYIYKELGEVTVNWAVLHHKTNCLLSVEGRLSLKESNLILTLQLSEVIKKIAGYIDWSEVSDVNLGRHTNPIIEKYKNNKAG